VFLLDHHEEVSPPTFENLIRAINFAARFWIHGGLV
jgi:hypothetical protein